MAKRGGEPRLWPYALLFVLLFAGALWGRKVEVSQRNAARYSASATTVEFEVQLADELSSVRRCLDDGACVAPESLGLRGAVHENGPADEQFLLYWADKYWPEYHDYFELMFEWNAALRSSTLPNGTISDMAALTALMNGPMPGRLTTELADSRQVSEDRYDRGRLLSRVFGWGWKLCLALMFVLPITASIRSSRQHQRMLYTQWREAMDRKNPPPLIPVGPSSERT